MFIFCSVVSDNPLNFTSSLLLNLTIKMNSANEKESSLKKAEELLEKIEQNTWRYADI